jgi:hypothetical protein
MTTKIEKINTLLSKYHEKEMEQFLIVQELRQLCTDGHDEAKLRKALSFINDTGLEARFIESASDAKET